MPYQLTIKAAQAILVEIFTGQEANGIFANEASRAIYPEVTHDNDAKNTLFLVGTNFSFLRGR
ncbi:MAG TPA: hypothetical protein VGE82_02250 [Nitrososphaera sp.]|jgi:hypothetical protein